MTVKTKPFPQENLATDFTRAIVTTRWGKNGYRPLVIKNIESYYVDTSLDNDTDPWYIEIGDPNGDYLETLHRDNEVRVQIFGVGARKTSLPIVIGVSDDITYNSEGILAITGRDYSSLAVDSTKELATYRGRRAWSVIAEDAKALGFSDVEIAKSGPEGLMTPKAIFTDGSESYWEFWYRLMRRERMWLWTEPTGKLVGGILNYAQTPLYYFGTPRKHDPRSLWAYYVPVERLEIKKSTQSRVGEVWVYGQKGDSGIPPAFVTDPTTRGWIKRPRKIILSKDATTHKMAVKEAWDEIFEGKVGSIEITLTIADPGFEIKQNEIAVLNLPDPGITGEYFVVGVRRQVGVDGFVQEVRLRERNYAITRRVPTDVQPDARSGPASLTNEQDLNSALSTGIPDAPQDWMPYFIKAANIYHGPWDYNLFLATLLGICKQETNFQNERSNGHPGGSHVIWYPWNPQAGKSAVLVEKGISSSVDAQGRTKAEWENAFRNEVGGTDWAVGPMQLLTRSLKVNADNMLGSHGVDQFGGGRWVPEYNILEAARYFRECLTITVKDSARTQDIWVGVAAYERGPGAGAHDTPYSNSVKNYVMNDPGFLQLVTQGRTDSESILQGRRAQGFNPVGDTSSGAQPNNPGAGNSRAAIANLNMIRLESPHVDIIHVDYKLLLAVNSLANALGRVITIASGYRWTGNPGDPPGAAPNGGDTQWYLWDQYKLSGMNISHIAAFPGTSNHERGEAVDCNINGINIKHVVSSSVLAQYGLHGTVAGDWPHITLLSVTG